MDGKEQDANLKENRQTESAMEKHNTTTAHRISNLEIVRMLCRLSVTMVLNEMRQF
jgi:hypothetical protein